MVRVPFEPLGWPGATALQVQTLNGDTWEDAGTYTEVGTFPGYVDSVDVVRQYTSLPTFRYRWMVGSYSTEWSGSWSVGDLAPLYLWVVDLRDFSDSQYVTGATTAQLDEVIRAAKNLLDENLGPFTTSKEGWPDAIRLAMRRQVEFQLMMESPENMTYLTGLSKEVIGSYQYERNMTYTTNMEDNLGSVPDHVKAILDPYITDVEAQTGVYRDELPQIFETQKFPKLPPKIEESRWRREGVQ